MFNSRATDHLTFLARQLVAARETRSLDEALAQLSAASPARYADDIQRLQGLLGNEEVQDTTLGLSPFATLAKLFRALPDRREALLSRFVDYLQQSRAVHETFLTGIIGLCWYLAIVGLIAVVINTTYSTYVYPSVAGLLRAANEPPPALAVLLFENGWAAHLAVLLVLTLGLSGGFVWLLYRRAERMAPMPKIPGWVPGQRLCAVYNLGLLVNFARMLHESGLAGAEALEQAALITGHRRDGDAKLSAPQQVTDGAEERLQRLAIARQMETLPTELQAQCDEHMGQLAAALLTTRERLATVLKLGLFLYVGMIVIAMYLPIFQSNSII